MAVTLKQSGAQSATFLVTNTSTASITAASFVEAKDGQLKTFAETPFTSKTAMFEEWARIGGVYNVSTSSSGGATLTISRDETDHTPIFGASGLDAETAFYVLRIQTRYSASE